MDQSKGMYNIMSKTKPINEHRPSMNIAPAQTPKDYSNGNSISYYRDGNSEVGGSPLKATTGY